MKKLIVTLAIIFGLEMTPFAQNNALGGGGLLQRGDTPRYDCYGNWGNWGDLGWTRTGPIVIGLLNQHNISDDYDSPLGPGIAILAALGGVYLVAKRRKEE